MDCVPPCWYNRYMIEIIIALIFGYLVIRFSSQAQKRLDTIKPDQSSKDPTKRIGLGIGWATPDHCPPHAWADKIEGEAYRGLICGKCSATFP